MVTSKKLHNLLDSLISIVKKAIGSTNSNLKRFDRKFRILKSSRWFKFVSTVF